jgi:NADH-quinone oxidoreductase subunit C
VADGQQAVELLEQRFPGAVLGSGSYREQHWAEVELARLFEIASYLRDEPGLRYDYLVDVTAVHWPLDAQPMQIVYHLFSYARNDRLRLKVRTGERGPVPSVADLWASADWNERETFDMFGIEFEGHPDLRRILMPDDYTDFPLRKELPLYRG